MARSLDRHFLDTAVARNSLSYRSIANGCGGIEGNSDLYGLGIRLGVYLQWISSWLIQTLNPSGITTTHDANSIFVLAILTAMLSATARDDIKPIESYIMLLICFGYFFTVLSIFGLRVHFANPNELSKLLHRLRPNGAYLHSIATEWRLFWAQYAETTLSKAPTRMVAASVLDVWKIFRIRVSFGIASFIKHPAVSWAGVAWRISIAGILFLFNLLFWWSAFKNPGDTNTAALCYGEAYFFGERSLDSWTVTVFFRVSSILLFIPVAFLASVLINIILAMWRFTRDVLFRKVIVGLVELMKPGAWDRLSDRRKLIFGITLAMGGAPGTNPLSTILDVMLETVTDNKFWTINKADIPPLKDLVAGYVQLLSRGMEVKSDISSDPAYNNTLGIATALCFMSHALTLGSIALFIYFIEATILFSHISGVYTVNTTGQLIPFVVGIASSAAALRELLLLWLRRVSNLTTYFPIWPSLNRYSDILTGAQWNGKLC